MKVGGDKITERKESLTGSVFSLEGLVNSKIDAERRKKKKTEQVSEPCQSHGLREAEALDAPLSGDVPQPRLPSSPLSP